MSLHDPIEAINLQRNLWFSGDITAIAAHGTFALKQRFLQSLGYRCYNYFTGSVLKVIAYKSLFNVVWYLLDSYQDLKQYLQLVMVLKKTFWCVISNSINIMHGIWCQFWELDFTRIGRFILDVLQRHTNNICMCQFIEKHAILHMCIKALFERHHRNLQTFISYVHLYVEIIICTSVI